MQNTEAGKAVADVLSVLAEKLGSTGEYLWGVMVRGAFVGGLGFAIFSVLGALGFAGGWTIAKRGFALDKEKEDGSAEIIGGILLSIGCAVVVLVCTYGAVIRLGAPEYVALREILSALK